MNVVPTTHIDQTALKPSLDRLERDFGVRAANRLWGKSLQDLMRQLVAPVKARTPAGRGPARPGEKRLRKLVTATAARQLKARVKRKYGYDPAANVVSVKLAYRSRTQREGIKSTIAEFGARGPVVRRRKAAALVRVFEAKRERLGRDFERDVWRSIGKWARKERARTGSKR